MGTFGRSLVTPVANKKIVKYVLNPYTPYRYLKAFVNKFIWPQKNSVKAEGRV